MAYLLFILINVVLFVRPAELFPSAAGWPLYEYLILACSALAAGPMLEKMNPRSWRNQAAVACVLGLTATVVMSHVARGSLWDARHSGMEFAKNVVYFLLLISVVDSWRRLRTFLFWLLCCITALAVLPLATDWGFLELDLKTNVQQTILDRETGEASQIPRLQSTGIFSDPNDLAMVLVVGMLLSLYFLDQRRQAFQKPLFLALIALFGYAFYLTHSRGGLLSLLVGLGVLFQARYGWRKTVLLGAAALPALAAVGGRMTEVSAVDDGTGQARIQLWSDGLALFRQSPIFGVGYDRYAESAGQVAHNSFIHCFTELGFFGGALFLGAVLAAVLSLTLPKSPAKDGLVDDAVDNGEEEDLEDGATSVSEELERLRPYLLAIVVGYAAAMMTLSRAYVVPTYLILGLATVWSQLSAAESGRHGVCFNTSQLLRLTAASVGFLLVMQLFVRMFVRF